MQIISLNHLFTITTLCLLIFTYKIPNAFNTAFHSESIYLTFQNTEENHPSLPDTLHSDTITSALAESSRTIPKDSLPVFNYRNVKNYIFSNLYYPEEAQQNKIEGKILVHFCIQEDGKINDIRIVKAVHPLLDSAALQLIRNMPQWQPIIRQGIPQSISYTIPIEFELKD